MFLINEFKCIYLLVFKASLLLRLQHTVYLEIIVRAELIKLIYL